MSLDLEELISSYFALCYRCGDMAGRGCNFLVTGILATPTIILDKIIEKLAPCCKFDRDYQLRVHRFGSIIDRDFSGYKSTELYRGGFFAKYPVGVAAEAVGGLVNVVVTTVVTLAAAVVGLVAMLGLGLAVLGLGLCAAILGGLAYGTSYCCKAGARAAAS